MSGASSTTKVLSVVVVETCANESREAKSKKAAAPKKMRRSEGRGGLIVDEYEAIEYVTVTESAMCGEIELAVATTAKATLRKPVGRSRRIFRIQK